MSSILYQKQTQNRFNVELTKVNITMVKNDDITQNFVDIDIRSNIQPNCEISEKEIYA